MRLRLSNSLELLLALGFVSSFLAGNLGAQEILHERQASDAMLRQVPISPSIQIQPAAIQKQEPPIESANQEELKEILELRKSLGGGVISVLGDMAEGDAKQQLQAEFEAELGRLMGQETQSAPPTHASLGQPLPLMESMAQPMGGNINVRVAAMRRVSRNLEELAWELEEIHAFAEADQLRQQAQDLRRKSRLMLEKR